LRISQVCRFACFPVLGLLASSLFSSLASAQGSSPSSGSTYRGQPVRSVLLDPATERKITALIAQMTLEEKVGQVSQYSSGHPTGPGEGHGDYASMAAKGQIGSLFNVENAKAANQYQHLAVDKSRLHIPLIFGMDVIHGYRTTFPVPLALATTWDPEVVEKVARVAAEEASASGVRWTFSPMVDISRDPRWGRIIESAGEDPYLGSAIARAYVRGYQGSKLSAPDSVAACPKHFVGYGAVEAGRDYNTTEISEHTLREYYLPPFHAALDEGAPTIMAAFNTLNGVPASANPFTLTQILRSEWQFAGLTVSDWTSLGELIPHGIANDGATAARKAFNAGLDLDMESDVYHANLADLVKGGQVSQARLDDAVRHILRVKFALGLFDHPYTDESRSIDGPIPADRVNLARTAAERSFVLLKNDSVNGRAMLPLSKDVKIVALIGPLGDDAANMLGSWAGHGKPEDAVTLKSALEQRLGAGRVKFVKGGEIPASSDADIEQAVVAARDADIVILALGEDAPSMTAEAGSRAFLDLPGQQEELLEKVAATGKPVVLVLFSGRPLTLPWAFSHVTAALAAWFPGIQAGPALTRVLFGDVAPTGRLVVSWPRTIGQVPLYYDALNTGRPADKADLSKPGVKVEDKFVSRYVDEVNAPMFPFGFGLSYSNVTYSRPDISVAHLSAAAMNQQLRQSAKTTSLSVSATIGNSGTTAVDEVVQVYVRLQGTSVEEPVRGLKAFRRVQLAPQESKKVTFELGPEAFALWSIDNEWTVEASKVHVWISPDASQGEAAELEITQ